LITKKSSLQDVNPTTNDIIAIKYIFFILIILLLIITKLTQSKTN